MNMRIPRARHYFLSAIALGLASLCASSCATTFPKGQLTLDLSNEIVPVSYNQVEKSVKTRTFSYEAGYQSRSVSSSSSNGKTTATVTVTMSSNQNSPIGNQMQAIFINDPEWAAISSLVFSVDLFTGFGASSTSLMLKSDTVVPLKK
jgi:hypothetical protein